MRTDAAALRTRLAIRHAAADAGRLRRALGAPRGARRLRGRLRLGLRRERDPARRARLRPPHADRGRGDGDARLRAPSTCPVVVDADTGYGNAVNVMRTVARARARRRRRHLPRGSGVAEALRPHAREARHPGRRAGRRSCARRSRRGATASSSSSRAPTRARPSGSTTRSRGRSRTARPAPTRSSSRRRNRVDELREIGRRLPPPLVANMVEQGVTPDLSAEELAALGFQLDRLSGRGALRRGPRHADALRAAACRRPHARGARSAGRRSPEFNALVGLDEKYALDERFGAADPAVASLRASRRSDTSRRRVRRSRRGPCRAAASDDRPGPSR